MASLSPGFQKLLKEPAFCELATNRPDGYPQIYQLWVDTDGEHVILNTRQKSVKIRHIQRDPRVAVHVVDPGDQWRLATVRGRVVDVTIEGADQHIDALAKKYRGWDEYPYKDENNPRVIVKVLPEHVHEMGLDGT